MIFKNKYEQLSQVIILWSYNVPLDGNIFLNYPLRSMQPAFHSTVALRGQFSIARWSTQVSRSPEKWLSWGPQLSSNWRYILGQMGNHQIPSTHGNRILRIDPCYASLNWTLLMIRNIYMRYCLLISGVV